MRYDLEASIHGEKVINEYLCKYLYDDLYNKNYILAGNKEAQLSGIDYVVYNDKGKPFSVDEKAQIGYINRPRNTFILEISFLDRGMNVKEGWFIKNIVNPNYYEFIWIHKSKESNKMNIRVEDIEEVECMFVSNRKLQEYIYKKGFTDKSLMALSDKIRIKFRKEDYGYIIRNGLKFVITNTLKERPVNIVMRKEVLMNLATSDYIVTPKNFRKIK